MKVMKNLTLMLALAVPTAVVTADEIRMHISQSVFTPDSSNVSGRISAEKDRFLLPRMEFSDIRITPPRVESPEVFPAPEALITVEDSDRVIHYQSWN